MRASLLALVGILLTVPAIAAGTYRLLVLDDHPVKWGESTFGTGAEITYSFVHDPIKFSNAINCKAMAPVQGMLERLGITPALFYEEVRMAFKAWERVADLRFVFVKDQASADILVGAQAIPRGIAYANVWHLATDHSDIAPINRASICFNPTLLWEPYLDGDKKTFSIRQIVTHEIGHTIGLDHPGRTGQLMGFRYSEDVPGLQAGDILGAIKLYGNARAPKTRLLNRP